MLRRKVNKLLGSLLVVLFFLTFAQCSYNHLPIESPSEVVQKYTDAMKQYDMVTMQKLMSSDANRTNSAAAGLIGDIVGGFTGFNFNMDCFLQEQIPLLGLFKFAINIKEAKSQKQLLRFQKTWASVSVVIIDELGYLSFDLEGAELLFEYLALRYEQNSTIITSNLIFSEWVKIFKDQTLTMALLDRITQNAMILNMNGPSYRNSMGKNKTRVKDKVESN